MKYKIETSIDIEASSEEIWKILMTFEDYGVWNPFITSIQGERKLGGKLEANIQGMKFKPTIITYKEGEILEWRGVLMMRGLFDGEHSFRIETLGEKLCRFHHSERFSGILVWFFKGSLEKNTKPGFEAMNRALKELVERVG